MRKFIAVGYTKGLVNGWESLIPPVKAPSNWKDPEKIKQYENEARGNLMAEALKYPLTATVETVAFIDAEGNIFKTDKLELDVMSDFQTISCIGVFEMLNLLFLQAAHDRELKATHHWAKFSTLTRRPYMVHQDNLRVVIDPVETLLGSAAKELNDAGKLLERLGLSGNKLDTAVDRAIVAYILSRRLGL